MNNRWIVIIIAIILVVVFAIRKGDDNLIGPDFSTTTSSPIPSIRQYQFDEKTDLKKELESINPQVLDSDFEYE